MRTKWRQHARRKVANRLRELGWPVSEHETYQSLAVKWAAANPKDIVDVDLSDKWKAARYLYMSSERLL